MGAPFSVLITGMLPEAYCATASSSYPTLCGRRTVCWSEGRLEGGKAEHREQKSAMDHLNMSRRGFLAAGLAGAAGALAAPAIANQEKPSNRIRTGFVGIGGRGGNLLG